MRENVFMLVDINIYNITWHESSDMPGSVISFGLNIFPVNVNVSWIWEVYYRFLYNI